MTADTTEPTQRDVMEMWRQVGDILVGGRFRIEERLDRIEGRLDRLEGRLDRLEEDVAVLKTEVAELKVDMKETKERLSRFELATERRFDRLDAQLERLIGYIMKDETGKP